MTIAAVDGVVERIPGDIGSGRGITLGFKLRGEGRMLADFAAQLDDAGQVTVPISTG